MRGLAGKRFEHDGRAGQIIEQRVELGVEQRQPVFHAGIAAAFAHGLIKLIVRSRGAEGLHVAEAKPADRLAGELELGDRHQIECAQLVGRALRLRIEGADRFQRVAEEIEPHRLIHPGRKEIENAAAHRVLAGLAHRRGAHETVELEPAHDVVHAQDVARTGRQRLRRKQLLGRHALQHCVDRGQQHRRPVAALEPREPRQRGHALGNNTGVRRDPVIGLAIPGREFELDHVRPEELQRAGELRRAAARRGRSRAGSSPARWVSPRLRAPDRRRRGLRRRRPRW